MSPPARHDLQQLLAEKHPDFTWAYQVVSPGCYASCTFCSIHHAYGDRSVVRGTPTTIVSEMEYIKEPLVDDRFITPSPRGIQCGNDSCIRLTGRKQDMNGIAPQQIDFGCIGFGDRMAVAVGAGGES
ncbi:hypothetical protein [Streptomyces sp. Root369]|uniref:hypothetical protein n=1 Tax=Streptomyces sp. Root369 TaxID=1736523 RepID=UPI000710800C|nr:hypothetical protein [Streptomyces sp. Root369]KQW13994.1 hypothetical protein ASD08_29775 [Streptomyces sp. Root369]